MKKKIINQIDELTLLYYRGDFSKINASIISLSEILVQYINEHAEELDIAEINDILEELLTSVKKQDFVLINDILNYFVKPMLSPREN